MNESILEDHNTVAANVTQESAHSANERTLAWIPRTHKESVYWNTTVTLTLVKGRVISGPLEPISQQVQLNQ